MLANWKKETTVDIVLQTLKKKKLFPISIPTAKCPKDDQKCNLKHGDYVIFKYDPTTDRFFVRSYPVHREEFLETWFTSDKLKEMFIRCLRRKQFTIPKLLEIINIRHTYRKKVLGLRFTDDEMRKITRDAKREKQALYDYARSKILS